MSKIKFIPHKTYGKQKTYTDLRIALIRERGILNVWRDYCDKNGLVYKNGFYNLKGKRND